MAQLVAGFGSSHSPQLNLTADSWHIRGEADQPIPDLIGCDGIVSGYDALLARRDDLPTLGDGAKDRKRAGS